MIVFSVAASVAPTRGWKLVLVDFITGVVFGSILPVNNYTDNAKSMLEERHPEELREINRWLATFCRERGYQYADYYGALVDDHGLLQRDLTADGIHPLANGYARMAPIAAAAIARALRPSAVGVHHRR